MSHPLLTAIGVTALSLSALPALAAGNGAPTFVITADCFRGPWTETIWDHPQGSFVADLVAYGYSFADADAIARNVCKDVSLVNDPDALKARVLQEVTRLAPPQSR